MSNLADRINWVPELVEFRGEPLTGYLEILAGQVRLIRQMLPASDRTNAIPRRPHTGLSIDRRAHGAES